MSILRISPSGPVATIGDLELPGNSIAGNPLPAEDIARAILMAQNTVLVRAAGNIEALSIPPDTVLGRSTGNLGAAQLVNSQYLGGALGTVKGVPFNGNVGQVLDLNGQSIGAIIRFTNAGDGSTSGPVPTYPLASNVTMVTFNSVTNVLDGVATPSTPNGQLLIVHHIGAGTTTIVHESTAAGAAAQRFRLGTYGSNVPVIVLGGTAPAQTAIFLYDGTRWVWINQAIGQASIIPNALAPVSSNFGVDFSIVNIFAAGGGGAPDDIVLTTSALPGFRILDVLLDVATAVVGSSCQLRNATGGAGGSVSSVLSSAATGTVRNNVVATNTIALGGTLVLRRSDSGVAGTIIVRAVPI